MTSIKRQENGCTICGKMAGIFSCRGCTGTFCLNHTSEHRDRLQKSMDEITHNYEQLTKKVPEQTTEQYEQLLVKQIDQWEEESIEKIRRLANNTRQELNTTVHYRADHLKEKLEQFKQQLDKAEQDGGFYENDLKRWSKNLHELQHTFIDQQIIQIDEDSTLTPFISKISLNEICSNSFRNGSQSGSHHRHSNASNKDCNECSSQPERDGYSLGKHVLRYTVEDYSSILFGIVSARESSFGNPEKNPTFYGWTDKNLVYRGGVPEENYQNFQSDFEANDLYILTINCVTKRISLKNERTQRSYDLDVDLEKCPFPWKETVRVVINDE